MFNKSESQNQIKLVDDLLAPSAVSISANYLQIGEKFARTLFVINYPRYLTTNWFSPVVNLDQPLDATIYIHPQETGAILKRLRDKLGQLQAETIEEQSAGKVRDPIKETAIGDIEALRDKLQQGTDKFFELGVYITIYGDSVKELDETENQIRGILDSQLVYTKEATFRMREGLFSSFPLNDDQLNVHTSLNTEPISSLFPFVSYDLTSDKGVLYGINTHNNSLVLFDRFGLENANMVVFGKSGGGKSILGSESVLVKNSDQIEMAEIGPLIEKLIKKHGAGRIDDELEGVINPGFEVWAFDKNLKGSWSKVTIAARKTATPHFYRFTTKSGRAITTTGDHNLVTIQGGRTVVVKSSEIKKGQFLPIPRQVESGNQPQQFLNLLKILKTSKGVYVAGASKLIEANYRYLKGVKLDSNFDHYLSKYADEQIIPLGYFSKILDFLKIGSTDLSISNFRITSRLQNNSLPLQWSITAQFTKLLGYVVSEGTITQDSILISNLDQEVLDDIGFALKSIGAQFYFGNHGVIIADRIFVEIIKSLCGEKKSGTKIVPPFIFNLDRALVAAFIQAYFEGDGGVEHSSVAATSKSRQLVSELSYLMYYFGIIVRIKKIFKKAPGWNQKKPYWLLRVSGQDNLNKFATDISFISQRKRRLLGQISKKLGNTNVDLIPGLQSLFEDIYRLIPFRLRDFHEISALKRGGYNPSPKQLQIVVEKIENKIATFKNYGSYFRSLNLPNLEYIIETGGRSKKLNYELRKTLGDSWRLIKNRKIKPGARNVLKALKILDKKFAYSLQEIKDALHFGFIELGLSIKHFQPSLQAALVDRYTSNTDYGMLWHAGHYITQKYQEKLVTMPRIEQLLAQLKVLAKSDLFWDPIEKIEKIKNLGEKYVYDLTVDNEVFLAGRGGMFVHNSYAVKLEILRNLMFGTQVFVIDPENEYKFLSDTVGGTSVKISIASDDHINPFDLPKPLPDESPADVLRSHILNLTGLLKLMVGAITPEEEALLDEAITQTYAIKDITPNTDFKNATPPLMSDFQTILEGMTGTTSLAIRIKKYTEGSFAGFLNNPTNVVLNNQFVSFSIRDMEEELRPIAMYLVLNYIWTQVRTELRKRLLVVDEAWLLLKYEAGGIFLLNLAKRARKYFLGLTTISQDIPDFMNSPYGKPIVTNSSLQLLLKQSPASIDLVKQTFNLTDAEKFFLLESRVGHGLFFAGQNHVALRIVASYAEDQTITSDPRQILEIEEAKKELAKSQ